MQRIGLALSGGGFRATLFHLGMVRFLREANILPAVTHVTSVSGGSVMGAHLVLNWDRYNGSLQEFDYAADELLRFVQLDVRNRVVRRYPLTLPLQALRRLTFRRPYRHMTRTGLLEYHYEKYLYGDTCLFQLPEKPRLSIMTTNLSEGCLCAFTRDGLLVQRRVPGEGFRFDLVHTGLATLPMAVTASSAFPGFFPPLELTAQDVGADPGQFGRLAFTDGGVYDNLGVRMFRWLERSWMAREVRLQKDDLADTDRLIRALAAAAQDSQESPLRRLAEIMDRLSRGKTPAAKSGDEQVDRLVDGLWDVMSNENLAHEPVFARLAPPDPDFEQLMAAAQHLGGKIETGEQLWLNRQLVNAAFRQATGEPCFRSPNVCFDVVFVSDSGKRFKIENSRTFGMIGTSMRSTEIVMDRVWQLEIDTFAGTPGFVFAPISKVVEPWEDPTACHPEVQRMATDIRSDFDRFSPLEISSLIRHGYCVGRSACRSHPDLFGMNLPNEAPWDPLPLKNKKAVVAVKVTPSAKAPQAVSDTEQSRLLQRSAQRRVWSTLLDYRDWLSYLYVPILIPILVLLPYFIVKTYERSRRVNQIVESLAQGSRDLEQMTQLLDGPVEPWSGVQDVEKLGPDEKTDLNGFVILQDLRIIDLRAWKPAAVRGSKASDSRLFGYRRLKVQKTSQESTNNLFRVSVLAMSPETQVRFPAQQLRPRLYSRELGVSKSGERLVHWEIGADFQKVPFGEAVDLVYEHLSPGTFVREEAGSATLTFDVEAETIELSRWLLMPQGRKYRTFQLIRYPTDKPDATEKVNAVTEYLAEDSTILAFKLLSLKAGHTYEITWFYQ